MEIFCEVTVEENEILYTKRCPKDKSDTRIEKKFKHLKKKRDFPATSASFQHVTSPC